MPTEVTTQQLHTNTHTDTHKHIYTHTYIHSHTFTPTHIHTHTHTQTLSHAYTPTNTQSHDTLTHTHKILGHGRTTYDGMLSQGSEFLVV